MKKSIANILSDYLIALTLGVIGIILIATGFAYWRPLAAIGAVFIILALFTANIWL